MKTEPSNDGIVANINSSQPPKKKRLAIITIKGRDQFTLPILHETTTGFVCRTGQHDSPATEWFPFNSVASSAAEIGE